MITAKNIGPTAVTVHSIPKDICGGLHNGYADRQPDHHWTLLKNDGLQGNAFLRDRLIAQESGKQAANIG